MRRLSFRPMIQSLVLFGMGFVSVTVLAEASLNRPRFPGTLPEPEEESSSVETARYPFEFSAEGIQLPVVLDKKINQLIRSPNTVFYKLPRIYQQYNPPSVIENRNRTTGRETESIFRGNWGIYYSTFEPDFNGNHAFPWEGTFGLNHAAKEGQLEKRYGSFNMLSLPEDPQGRVVPIYILNEKPIKWIYPVGTLVAEFLWIRDEFGKKWIYEIRCREKQIGSLTWEPIVYRPVRNRKELLFYLQYPENWTTTKTHFYLRNVHEDEVAKFEGFVERLPKLRPDQVRALLSRPFTDVTYEMWGELNQAPTSDQEFSIVPKNYSLGLVSVDEVSCATCHRQTQISLWNLIPHEPLIYENPTKVANIRGSDAIFTWYPFTQQSVSDGYKTPQALANRYYDTARGFVKVITPNVSEVDPSWYRLTKYVQEALKPYELPTDRRFLH